MKSAAVDTSACLRPREREAFSWCRPVAVDSCCWAAAPACPTCMLHTGQAAQAQGTSMRHRGTLLALQDSALQLCCRQASGPTRSHHQLTVRATWKLGRRCHSWLSSRTLPEGPHCVPVVLQAPSSSSAPLVAPWTAVHQQPCRCSCRHWRRWHCCMREAGGKHADRTSSVSACCTRAAACCMQFVSLLPQAMQHRLPAWNRRPARDVKPGMEASTALRSRGARWTRTARSALRCCQAACWQLAASTGAQQLALQTPSCVQSAPNVAGMPLLPGSTCASSPACRSLGRQDCSAPQPQRKGAPRSAPQTRRRTGCSLPGHSRRGRAHQGLIHRHEGGQAIPPLATAAGEGRTQNSPTDTKEDWPLPSWGSAAGRSRCTRRPRTKSLSWSGSSWAPLTWMVPLEPAGTMSPVSCVPAPGPSSAVQALSATRLARLATGGGLSFAYCTRPDRRPQAVLFIS